MNKIELSPDFVNPMITRVVGYNTLFSYPNSLSAIKISAQSPLLPGLTTNTYAGSGTLNAFLKASIMKGVMPTDFTNGNTIKTLESDILVDFTFSDFKDTPKVNPFLLETKHVTAIATGMATWFWFRLYSYNIFGEHLWVNSPLINQFMCNVGVVGSGSDLEMNDVNVISGNLYRISKFRLQFPTSWEV